jgi:glutamine amidotransferase
VIAIIDYNIGNISAVVNMLQRLGVQCKIATCSEDVVLADKIILPGNGAFDACMNNLRLSGLIPVLEHQVLQLGRPLLGICVGAQMLGYSSEEGCEPGLGWLNMRVKRFPVDLNLRIPHMGWNNVIPTENVSPLAKNIDPDSRFYFVHSYFMLPDDPADVMFRTHYGIDFSSGVSRGNISGVQFHPEKSHRFGRQLLADFAGLT